MKHHDIDMNDYGTDMKHHSVDMKLNAVDAEVNSIDVDVTVIDMDLDIVMANVNVIDMDLPVGRVKLPLVDMRWHFELRPFPRASCSTPAAGFTCLLSDRYRVFSDILNGVDLRRPAAVLDLLRNRGSWVELRSPTAMLALLRNKSHRPDSQSSIL